MRDRAECIKKVHVRSKRGATTILCETDGRKACRVNPVGRQFVRESAVCARASDCFKHDALTSARSRTRRSLVHVKLRNSSRTRSSRYTIIASQHTYTACTVVSTANRFHCLCPFFISSRVLASIDRSVAAVFLCVSLDTLSFSRRCERICTRVSRGAASRDIISPASDFPPSPSVLASQHRRTHRSNIARANMRARSVSSDSSSHLRTLSTSFQTT